MARVIVLTLIGSFLGWVVGSGWDNGFALQTALLVAILVAVLASTESITRAMERNRLPATVTIERSKPRLQSESDEDEQTSQRPNDGPH